MIASPAVFEILRSKRIWVTSLTFHRSRCVRRLSSVRNVFWCVLEQMLLLTAYRKSYMRNRLLPK